MSITSLLARSIGIVAIATGTVAAHAMVTVYTSESDFQAALAYSTVDTFDDLAAGFADSPLDRTSGAFGYTASVDGGFYQIDSAGDIWLSTVNAEPVLFGNFSGGVAAIGGHFFATDLGGSYLGGESLTVTVKDAFGLVTRTLVDPSVTTFLGFVSDGEISELQVAVVDTGSNNAFVSVDALTLGQPLAPVPEPETYALLLVGLAAVAATARRRAGRR